MKKIWLVGLGALLATALSASASVSFIWSTAGSPVITGGGTIYTWTENNGGGVESVSLTLLGGVTFTNGTPAGVSSPFVGEEFTSLFTNTAQSIPFTIKATAPGVGAPEFFVGNASISAGGTINLSVPATSPGLGTFSESVSGTTPLTATFVLSDIVFPTVPETNQLAIALGAAVVGATVLFRSRRSASV